MLISKSLFVDYKDFPKIAWWKQNNLDIYKKIKGIEEEEASNQLIELGQKVEDLVGEYFLKKEGLVKLDVFEDIINKNPFNEEDEDIYLIKENYKQKREKNLKRTIEAIKNKEPLIYQPGFLYKGLFVRGDYLKLNESGNYDLIEVKAKTGVRNICKTKANLENQFLNDISFQKYVLTKTFEENNLGIIGNFYYAYLNKHYKKNGDLNFNKLVVIEQVDLIQDIANNEGDLIKTDDTLLTFGQIEESIKQIKTELILSENEFNKIYPFSGSKYIEYFGKDREFGTIYGKGLTSPVATRILHYKNKILLNDLSNEEQELFNKSDGSIGSARQYIINYLKANKENKDYIDIDSIRDELNNVKYPICFYDYETCSVSIPFLDNTSPYQQTVVQYSLHKVYEDGKIKHFGGVLTGTGEKTVKQIEIADNKNKVGFESEKVITGGYKDLLDEFIKDIGNDLNNTFIVWYKAFENTRNKEIAETFSDLKEKFETINNNTYDLMDIFKKGYYYSLKFKGSNSIKYVLPALVPKMSYEGMEVANGLVAMQILNNVIEGNIKGEEKEKQIKNLLLYCGQDSLAMYEIYKFINKITLEI